MGRQKIFLFSLSLFALAVLLSGCKPDPNDAYIQGTWYYNDQHLLTVPGESKLETWWTFDRGSYHTYSCCFYETDANGRYDIVSSEGNVLIIELFNRLGDPSSERVEMRLVIDREAETLKIQSKGPFTRVSP